jgi:hypothetical protein
MIFYRVFSWDGSSQGRNEGGPLYVPKSRQGSGRHDNPELYGAVYCSMDPVACIAEALQPFRNQSVEERDLRRRPRSNLALVQLQFDDRLPICDLDEPKELSRRRLRPSRVATLDRRLTQEVAAGLFRDGFAGFLWWSVLESLWINATLFAERAETTLVVTADPRVLHLTDEEVAAAARRLGVRLVR